MPTESFIANSANMHYPLKSLDGQDLIEVFRVLEKCSEHVLCLKTKQCLKENLEIAKERTSPEVHRISLQILEIFQKLNFIWGGGGLLSASRQRSTINTKRWLDVNEVFKALHPWHSKNWLQHDSHLSPPPSLPPPPHNSPRSCWIAMIPSGVRNV